MTLSTLPQELHVSPSVELRETSVLRMPENSPENLAPDSPVTPIDLAAPIDLWVALDRLGRDDSDMLAARRDAVRRSRRARRAIAAS
jgi:hypothetical protein